MASHLTLEERDRIAQLRARGHRNGQIARQLCRSASTIGREVARNCTGGEYLAATAHAKAMRHGFFIALEGDQVAAVTNLERWASTTALEFGYTVVRPDHRQRGLALALKVRALRFARERGCPTVCTLNSLANERMLRINEHLGFQRTRVWAELQRAKEWMP